ncbi:MAG: energy-coupling factor ABC transporter ATP-binding protein [Candidatus Methylomirabilales bacterium]
MVLSTSTLAIEAVDLRFAYPSGVEALRGVHLRIRAGEFVGVIGQNGSGKTTLVKHFNGLLKPTRGVLKVLGVDTRTQGVAKLATLAGYVFQNPDHQIFCNTVREEIAFGPRNTGMPPSEIESSVRHVMELLDLQGLEDRHPFRLSRGERQRLAIASILAMRPRLLILDEPTGGQDRQQVGRLVATLRGLNAEGHTIVLVTHDLELLAECTDRALVMFQGQILLDGTPRDVFREVETLRRTALAPPQITRWSLAIGMPRLFLTVAEAVAAYTGNGPGSGTQ